MPDLLVELERFTRLAAPRRAALSGLDTLKERLFAALAPHYDDYYAKLVALKLTNFALAKYHFTHRHTRLSSGPVTLMHDPSNACQLQCPACVHTDNESFSREILWPAATMKVAAFERALADIGPFALNVVYYNYGEPLLNKHVPEMLRISNGHGLSSCFSTNLSLKFDVEAFVAASPDHVILSIDGATEETYARYRKRGRLDLVLDNVRRLVAAKRREGRVRPYLSWRLFTFEHNLHEVDRAIELGRELGVNEVDITTPFDVALDDPGVRVAQSERRGRHVFEPWQSLPPEFALGRIVRHESVERFFDAGWSSFAETADDEPSHAASATCAWLYFSMTVDAAQRLMPCCMAPTRTRPLVYGNLAATPSDAYNLEGFRLARESFADRPRFDQHVAGRDPAVVPYCSRCSELPGFSYGPAEAAAEIRALDFRAALNHDAGALGALGSW